MKRTFLSDVVSWLALGIAVAAFIIAVSAFNKSGPRLDTVIGEEAQKTTEDVKLNSARTEAAAKLLNVKNRIEINPNDEGIADEVALIRSDLNDAYFNVRAEAKEKFGETDLSLQELERQIREGSSDVLGTLENVLALLRQEIANDN